MNKDKKPSHLTASLLLAPALALGAVPAEAQKKATPIVSRATLIKAADQELPKEAIRQAEVLIARARKTHNFPLLLEAEKIRWEQRQRLDYSAPDTSYARLIELAKLPWLSATDRAALQIFELRHYLDAYYTSSYEQRPQRQSYDPARPEEWPREQFVRFYSQRVEQLLSDLPTLLQPLQPYLNLFPQSEHEVSTGRTLASELLYELTYPAVADFTPLHAQILKTLQGVDQSQLTDYTASFIDQQQVVGRLSGQHPSELKSKARVEVETFVKRWGRLPIINNYLSWIRSLCEAESGLAKSRTLESIAQLATGLSKANKQQLAEDIQRSRQAQLYANAPERLVGRRDLTLDIHDAYLVREVELSLYPAPAGYDPTQRDWEVAPGAKPLWTKRQTLTLDSLGLLTGKISLPVSLPEAGAYQLILSYTQDKEARGRLEADRKYVYSSDYVALSRSTSDKTALQWFEARSGKPLTGAKLQGYQRESWSKPLQKLEGLIPGDSWGRFTISQGDLFHLAGSHDPLLVDLDYRRGRAEVAQEVTTDPQALEGFITPDRPAYRPGQTAHFYGIVSRIYRQAERAEVVAQLPLKVTIRDANHQQVHTEQVTTDALGRFTLSYPLPSEGLTGRYSISVSPIQLGTKESGTKEQERPQWNSTFQVFEYKRMDSQLLLDTPQLPLTAGSKVTITGALRTLSGSPIAGAKVKYALRGKRYFWSFRDHDSDSSGSQRLLTQEGLTTDEEGRFAIPLTLPEIAPNSEEFFAGKRIAFPWYRYELTVTTTDATGVVHTEELTLPAGREVAEVTPQLATLIDKQASEQPLTFEAKRSYADVDLLVRYSIQQGGRTLLSDSTPSGKLVDLAQRLRDLPAGRYELHYTTASSDSLSYTGSQAFYLFDSKRLTAFKELHAPLLLSGGSGHYSTKEKPVVYWASSLPEAYVFYEVYTGQGQLAEGLLRPEVGKMNTLPIDLSRLKDLPEEVHVRLWTVRDGRLLEERTTLSRTQPKKALTLHWESFRDRLRAGQQETWRLTLRTPDGKPASGTAVATWMYDSALDAFGTLPSWSPSLRLTHQPWGKYGNRYWSSLRQEQRGALEPQTSWYERWQDERAQGKFTGSALPPASLISQLQRDEMQRTVYYASPMLLGLESQDAFPMGRGMKIELQAVSVTSLRKSNVQASATVAQSSQRPPQLRTSFAENAFFLPQLTTGQDGSVSWSFTAPERLTRWRLLVLAHNLGMDHQTEVQTIETFRPFSIRPALPRFLSEGDSVSLVTEVSNDSETDQRGELELELFDPQSQQILHREATTFDVARGKRAAYSLPLTGFAGRDSVGVRIWAKGAEASDGEQHLLPVRSTRQPITERLTFTRHSSGSDTFSLATLLPKEGGREALQTGQLTLQASSHAAFFTLSALQGLATSQETSAFSLATSLYAQTLVSALRDIEGMKRWAEERTSQTTKAQDRHPALQQTPWAGVTDQEQRDELALARQLLAPVAGLESDRLLRQLEGLQDKQGLWSWYPGMQGSSYTTEAVLRLLLRLPAERLEEAHRLRLRQLVQAGLSALEQEAIKLHQQLTRKQASPMPFVYLQGLDYLCLASEGRRLGFTPTEAGKRAESFFLARLKKEAARLPLWQKPQAARTLLARGERQLAELLARSLREHLVTDETGSFFASLDASPYSWMDKTLPTVVETIQLLRQLGQGTSPEVEGMVRWVINQKRTNAWANELVSAEAIHALLLGESSQLVGGFAPLRVEVPLQQGKRFAASGHSLATTLPLSEIAPAPELIISQEKPSIVWGSAVATYTLPTEAVTRASGKELRLRREIFVVREEGGKEQLLPLSEGYELRVGERLRTWITIELDRSMDFLRLRDPRMGFAEPINQMPGYAWGEGTGYYYEPKDQTTAFYLDHLTRGTYRLSYDQRVARAGVFRGGVTELVSCYAPEFGAHTAVAPTTTVLPLQGK